MEVNENKSTPLDYALINDHVDIANYLVEYGALSVVDIQLIAAITIQTSYRAYKARKLLNQLKGDKFSAEASPQEHLAATQIGAIFKGYMMRQRLPGIKLAKKRKRWDDEHAA